MGDPIKVRVTIDGGMVRDIEADHPLAVQVIDLDILEYDDEADNKSYFDVSPSEKAIEFGVVEEDQ